MAQTSILGRLRPLARGRYGPVLAGRAVDQLGLGVLTLVLAARMAVDRFGIVALLLVVVSLAAAIADRGRSIAILRLGPEERLGSRALRAVRWSNAAIAIATAVGAAAITDSAWRTVVGAAGLLWAVSAEASISRSALLARRRAGLLGRCDAAGGALALVIVVVFADEGNAAAVLAVALVARALIVAVPARTTLRSCLDADSPIPRTSHIFWTQALAFAISNVDYVIALGLLGDTPLGYYLLAYRTSNAVPSQLATAFNPVALNEFATSPTYADQYHRLLSRLLRIGVVGALATAAVAPLLPPVLGDRWAPTPWIIVMLSVAIPFRMTLGLGGSVLIARQRERTLLRFEVVRLVVTSLCLVIGGAVGLRAFVFAVTVTVIVAHLALHHVAARVLGMVRQPYAAHMAGSLVACGIALWWAVAT